MCNIAGYAGKQDAAPILIDMIRRQEKHDGGGSTGIITIHEGRFYYRKVIGNIDTLLETTDALYLPGTVGIAHSRPVGTPEMYGYAHPFLSEDGRMAGITNGTVVGQAYVDSVQKATDFLQSKGYCFHGGHKLGVSTFPRLKNGNYISCVETRVNLVRYYVNAGMSITAAMARVSSECYTDSVLGIITLDTPDRFYINRTSRPAFSYKTDDGICVATCQFAFPDEVTGEMSSLPVMRPCIIKADGVEISEDRMSNCEEVSEIPEESFEIGYQKISELLKGKKDAPLHGDDIWYYVRDNMRDLFPGNHTLIQAARLIYEVQYRLYREGRLNLTVRPIKNGIQRYYMWVE